MIQITNATGLDLNIADKQFESTVTCMKKDFGVAIPFDIMTIPGPSWIQLHPIVIVEKVDGRNVKLRFLGGHTLIQGELRYS